ncbi:hypothetical protein D4764_0214320 [Takifugu flavidus]|uniref:Uncharacterized protein n=1 Tax=Takifugu flavidus TaxID=433684 RepID=A0A5C6MFJ0_9TELE|nr:hypothetical protein D4764_0214320 [Takifugu flavidus]
MSFQMIMLHSPLF